MKLLTTSLICLYLLSSAFCHAADPVSLTDFSKGAGGWYNRIWSADGKTFEKKELSVVKADSGEVKGLGLPIVFLGDLEAVCELSGSLSSWRAASHLELRLVVPEDLPDTAMMSLFAKDNDHLWRQVRGRIVDLPLDGGVRIFRVPLRGSDAVEMWTCHGHRRPWNPLTTRNLLEYGLRVELDTGVSAEYSGQLLLASARLLNEGDSTGDLQVREFSYAPLSPHVGQRLEVGFRLNAWPADPYDMKTTSITCVVTLPDGKTTEEVRGYYYEDFLYDRAEFDKTRCLEPNGEPSYKIRYCPRVAGRHSAVISIAIDGKSLTLPPLQFDVQGALPGYHGFIRVDDKHDQFFKYDDGTQYWGLGMNVRSPFDNRYFEVAPYSQWLDQGLSAYDRLFAKYRELGINTVEVWMSSWWLALEWINDAPGFHGVGHFNQYRAWMLDHILNLAEANGINLILVINNHGKFGLTFDTEWKRNPYNKELGGFLEKCEDYFVDAKAKAAFKKLADYMVARWGASPNLLSWKLFTEVDLTGPDLSHYTRDPNIAAWHAEMGKYLKSIDIYKHPVTTHWMLSYHRIDEAISSVPELDFLSTDAYYQSNGTTQLVNLLRGSSTFGKGKKKPLVITEFGGSSYADNMGALMKQVEVGLWTGFFTEMGILPMYWWFALVEDKQVELYGNYVAMSRYGSNEDRRGMAATFYDLKDTNLQLNELRSKNRLLYWIMDKEFFFSVQENLTLKEQKGVKVSVAAPEPGKYRIEFWSPKNGDVLGTQDVQVGDEMKMLEFELPEFTRSIAVKVIAVP
ncbi:MAG: hypothetical protein GX561_09565 [Lentisphaerae bacterium]|jgi:hypothetical protein|nr:hypothetical protein [Lentisphaerota bacterium]